MENQTFEIYGESDAYKRRHSIKNVMYSYSYFMSNLFPFDNLSGNCSNHSK